MRRFWIVPLTLIVLFPRISNSDTPPPKKVNKPPKPKSVEDIWEIAQIGKVRAGFFRTTIEEYDFNGTSVFRTSKELFLRVKRFKDVVELRMISGTEELDDGQVLRVMMRMFRPSGATTTLIGTVKKDKLHIDVDGGRVKQVNPWKKGAIGLRAQQMFFTKHKVKPGDEHIIQTFEPTLSIVIKITAKVRDYEEVKIFGAQRKLLKVDLVPDKVMYEGKPIPLPTMSVWLNEKGEWEQREVDMPPFGKVLYVRTTKDVALAPPGSIPNLPDLGLTSLITVDRRIGRPHDTDSIVYKITLDNEVDPKDALAEDARQTIKNVKGKTFELHVSANRHPPVVAVEEKVDEQFLESCYFLNWDDARVKAQAKVAVGNETDPWKKAQRIEKWVYRNVRNDNTVAFTTAGQIARQLRGDCRQHAMLGAAMCRAVGVPSRSAVGLIYVSRNGAKPFLGFHMWFEVWINGKWIALDPTLGRGSIGAAHIKIADHSWHDTPTLTPLLPVARVLGKMKVEVVEVDNRN